MASLALTVCSLATLLADEPPRPATGAGQRHRSVPRADKPHDEGRQPKDSQDDNRRPIEQIFPNEDVRDLYLAIRRHDRTAAETLISKGVNINSREFKQLTVLHMLTVDDDPEGVRLALALGADPNAVSESGSTPLEIAVMAKKHYPELTELLIKAGADIKLASKNQRLRIGAGLGSVIYHTSCGPRFRHEVELAGPYWRFLELGGDINELSIPPRTVISDACMNNSFPMILELLDRGANPHVGTSFRRSIYNVFADWPYTPEDSEAEAYQKVVDRLAALKDDATLIAEAKRLDGEHAKLLQEFSETEAGRAQAAQRADLDEIIKRLEDAAKRSTTDD